MTPRHLPDGFVIGCATAAHQVEGGTDNDWSRWTAAHPEAIAGGGDATIAIDHYHRYREDLAQLSAMHQTAHRFSIEWSRVEPQSGRFDRAALAHYADVVRTCRELGMEPVVTLHHFTLPAWLAAAGGVTSPDAPARFARYVAACVEALGDMVTWWITINEPAVLATLGYLEGTWPPGERSLRRATLALGGLLRMHAAGAQAIKTIAAHHGRGAQVSIAHHERRLVPRSPNSRIEKALAKLPDHLFNRWFLRSCIAGRMLAPVGHGEMVPGLAGSLTYLGLNHYANEAVSLDIRAPGMLFTRHEAVPGFPLSGTGWAIDPDALRSALTGIWDEFGLPIMITENGVADDHDELRPEYLRAHLRAVVDALDAGVDVRGYLYWTAWDNFEWAEGYTKRFGLFAVDRETLERIAKPSAALYAEICRTRSLPDAAPVARPDVKRLTRSGA
ncbi:MAG TPA: family 1 glycosylhydrolase [Candidatus Saccharimonadales bacterium]|nr:family 1 glycosylhydrolase [Candidatus Saccharimonadales bacterium]